MVSATLRSVVRTPWVWGKRVPHNAQVRDEQVGVWVVDDQASFRLATVATVAATEDFVMAANARPVNPRSNSFKTVVLGSC